MNENNNYDVSGCKNKEVASKTLDERCNENLLNLKILSEVNKNEKINVMDENIEIDSGFLQGARRWYYSQDRTTTLNCIENIIDETFLITDNILSQEVNKGKLLTGNEFYDKQCHNELFENDNSSKLQNFLIDMSKVGKGLDNLKQTYISDILIVSRIDIIKDRLDLRIKKIKEILKINI